jgi:hypothetical protein
VLSVEDWAGIRRLHRAEQMLSSRSPGLWRSPEHVERALADGPANHRSRPDLDSIHCCSIRLAETPTQVAPAEAHRGQGLRFLDL